MTNHGAFAEHRGDCMAVTKVVADMLWVSGSLVALAVGFAVWGDRVKDIAAVGGEPNRRGTSCLESGGRSGWSGSRLLSSVWLWSTIVCARPLSVSISVEGRLSFVLARPRGRSGSCFGLVCFHQRRRTKRKMITMAKIAMSPASKPPTIGPVNGDRVRKRASVSDIKLRWSGGGGRWVERLRVYFVACLFPIFFGVHP